MKWVEIITLRSPTNIWNTQLVEIRIYNHSIVETDLSIHLLEIRTGESAQESPRATVVLCFKGSGVAELFRMD